MLRWLSLSILLFTAAFSDIYCPHGCGNPYADERVYNIVYILETSLEKMGFLKGIDFGKKGWERWYRAYDYDESIGFYEGNMEFPKEGHFEWEVYIDDEYLDVATFHRETEIYTKSNSYEKIRPFCTSINKEYDLSHYIDFLKITHFIEEDIGSIWKLHSNFLEKSKEEIRKGLHLLRIYSDEDAEIYSSQINYEIFFQSPYIKTKEKEAELLNDLDKIEEDISEAKEKYHKHRECLQDAKSKIDLMYENIWNLCIENHGWPGAYYERGLQQFHLGNFEAAFQNVKETIKNSENLEELFCDIQLLKGKLEYELGLYHKAITSLSAAISLNPKKEELYFERAAAYFEVGKYEFALMDYLTQKERPSFAETGELLSFGSGFTKGASKGTIETLSNFIPSALSTLSGMGNHLWAAIQNPIKASNELTEATLNLINVLRTSNLSEITECIAPELYQLCHSWDELSSFERGSKAGYVMGKYGTDCLLLTGTLKGVKNIKVYHDLKKAEKMMALETLAESQTSKALKELSKEWSVKRAEYFSKVTIEIDKQGKHIPGHKNFLIGKSEWTYPNPEKKIKELAGSGRKIRGKVGVPGYKEIVDCGETIGYYIDESTKIRIPTTMAQIHYSKKGAHIVPAQPKKR